ncbi:hypothetical protein [Phytomonospora endophytica]|uniref:Putative nuclease with TOPRIM domain n=1 Tax=Phytomonospora endophytica TaxID=714109 RepID=A0A841FEI2_9ACTN|nr:hypothetical protein [Phytomonospora endophytica]MBB6035701.1 putative nuclease with TOPRIM domain [Phytomonospora endophytica]
MFWWIMGGAVAASLVVLVLFALPLVKRLTRLRAEMGELQAKAAQGDALRVRLEAVSAEAETVRQRLENIRTEAP